MLYDNCVIIKSICDIKVSDKLLPSYYHDLDFLIEVIAHYKQH